jgi:tRNA G46 methylase TrmB
MQAKFIVNKLNIRQKELHLMENLGEMFESNLTFSRMLVNFSEPAGWNKKNKARLTQLSDKTKDLVQALNDSFSTYNSRKPNSPD